MTGEGTMVGYNRDDNFDEFRLKVQTALEKTIKNNSYYDGKALLRIICLGKELTNEYYESVKTEFPKINCIHAIYK